MNDGDTMRSEQPCLVVRVFCLLSSCCCSVQPFRCMHKYHCPRLGIWSCCYTHAGGRRKAQLLLFCSAR